MARLNDELRDWGEMLRANNVEATVRHYRTWAERFEDWLDREPEGRAGIAGFDEFLRDGGAMAERKSAEGGPGPWGNCRPPGDGYAYGTRVMAASAAKSWLDFRYGVEFKDRQKNLVHNIVVGDRPAFDPMVARPEEVAAVIEDTRDCEADSCHAMTRLGYDAIMRGIELCRVRLDDLDMDRGTVYVRAAKGSKNRHIRLHDSTLDVLGEYRGLVLDRFDEPEYLFYKFYQHWWNKPWTADSWGNHFADNHWDGGWHSIGRHSAVTNRLRNGEPLHSVNQRARHSTMEMTSRYNQLAENGSDPLPELA